MNKTLFALIISIVTTFVTISVAQAAPEDNTFYAGLQIGSSSFKGNLNRHKLNDLTNQTVGTYSHKKRSFTYGAYAGYQFFNNKKVALATELSYNYLGKSKYQHSISNSEFSQQAQSLGLSLKADYSLGNLSSRLDGISVYAKAGIAAVRSSYKTTGAATVKKHNTKASPLYAVGIEYTLKSFPKISIRAEFQHINKVGKLKNISGDSLGHSPNVNMVTVGITYHFGKTKSVEPVVVNIKETAVPNNSKVKPTLAIKQPPKSKIEKNSATVQKMSKSQMLINNMNKIDKTKPKVQSALEKLLEEQNKRKTPPPGLMCNQTSNNKNLNCVGSSSQVKINVYGLK